MDLEASFLFNLILNSLYEYSLLLSQVSKYTKPVHLYELLHVQLQICFHCLHRFEELLTRNKTERELVKINVPVLASSFSEQK